MGIEHIFKKSKLRDENAKNEAYNKIKSRYILKQIYDLISPRKLLQIIKCNKNLQNMLDIDFRSYKKYNEIYSPIEIELIPKKNIYGEFIHINKEEEKEFYHIYFNDDKSETKNKYVIDENDKINKIKIVIDFNIISFYFLFNRCECIESISFKKFYRNNITDMSHMFHDSKI